MARPGPAAIGALTLTPTSATRRLREMVRAQGNNYHQPGSHNSQAFDDRDIENNFHAILAAQQFLDDSSDSYTHPDVFAAVGFSYNQMQENLDETNNTEDWVTEIGGTEIMSRHSQSDFNGSSSTEQVEAQYQPREDNNQHEISNYHDEEDDELHRIIDRTADHDDGTRVRVTPQRREDGLTSVPEKKQTLCHYSQDQHRFLPISGFSVRHIGDGIEPKQLLSSATGARDLARANAAKRILPQECIDSLVNPSNEEPRNELSERRSPRAAFLSRDNTRSVAHLRNAVAYTGRHTVRLQTAPTSADLAAADYEALARAQAGLQTSICRPPSPISQAKLTHLVPLEFLKPYVYEQYKTELPASVILLVNQLEAKAQKQGLNQVVMPTPPGGWMIDAQSNMTYDHPSKTVSFFKTLRRAIGPEPAIVVNQRYVTNMTACDILPATA